MLNCKFERIYPVSFVEVECTVRRKIRLVCWGRIELALSNQKECAILEIGVPAYHLPIGPTKNISIPPSGFLWPLDGCVDYVSPWGYKQSNGSAQRFGALNLIPPSHLGMVCD